MSAVHSARWYRVAALKPRLAATVQLRRQRLRGQTWYLLCERGAQRIVRLNAAAWAVAGRFDGQRSVQQLWDHLLGSGEDPPTQDEVIELLSQLREASLLQFDHEGDAERLPARLDAGAAPKRRNTLLAWRIPLADPSALLARFAPLGRLLFSRAAAWAWAAAVALLLVLAIENMNPLASHARQWMATPRYAALALLLYLPIKLLHEFAHGLAVQRWGGTVRQAGITLMLGLPVPWVDASAATGFAQRYRRIVVGAAGMMAELALAALALPLWLALPDGLARDAAFVTLFIAGVSTLLFNANPLQRLDGYYIATDALALPNLALRSRRWWHEFLRRHLLRSPGHEAMVSARGEAKWLALYAPSSWLCSLGIALLAVAWLGQLSFGLGVAGGLLLGWQIVVRPMREIAVALRRSALTEASTTQRWHRLSLAAGVLALALLLLPLPQRTLVQGVVWPPDAAQLRAEEEGFVAELLTPDGAAVRAGAAVLRLDNPALQAQYARQLARVDALDAEWVQSQAGSGAGVAQGPREKAGDVQAELVSAQLGLEQLRQRLAALTVRAGEEGRVALPQAADLRGSYLRRGTLFGQVLAGEAATVRVAVPEAEVGELQRGLRGIEVRLAASPERVTPARLLRDGAGAVKQLPSAALSQRHGGPVPTDPQDARDLRPLQPVVLLDLQLADGAAPGGRLGERAWVRFDTGFSPWSWQLARSAGRALQRRFNPAF